MTEFKNPIKELHQEFLSSSDINIRTSVFKLWLEAIVKFNLSVHVGWLMKNRRENVPDNIKVQLVNLFQKPPSIGVCLSLSRLINRIIPAGESIHGRMTEFRALFETSDSLFSELLEIRNAEAHSTRPITSFDLDKIQDYMNRISFNPFYALEVIPIQANQYVEAREFSMFANLNPTTFDNRKLPVLAGSGNYKPGNRMGEDDIVLFPVAVFDEKDALYLWNQRSGSNGKYSTYSKKSDSVVVNNITDISGFPYDDWKRSANPIYVKYLEVRSKALDDLPANKDTSIREVFNELNLARRLEDDAQIKEYERISEFQFLSIIYSRIEDVREASEKVYFLSFIVDRIEEYKTDVIDDFRRMRELQLKALLLLIKVEIDQKSFNRASDLSIFFIKKYIELTKSFYSDRVYDYYLKEFDKISNSYLKIGRNKFLRLFEITSFYASAGLMLFTIYTLVKGNNSDAFLLCFLMIPFLIFLFFTFRNTYSLFRNRLELNEIQYGSSHRSNLIGTFRYFFKYLSYGRIIKKYYGLFTLISFGSNSLSGACIRVGFLLHANKLLGSEFDRGVDKGIESIRKIEDKIIMATEGDDLEFVLALRSKMVQWLIKSNFYYSARRHSDIMQYYQRLSVIKSSNAESQEYKNFSKVLFLKYDQYQLCEKLFVAGSMNDLIYYEMLMFMWEFVQAEADDRREYVDSGRKALKDKAFRNSKTPKHGFIDGNFVKPLTARLESRSRFLRGFWLVNLGEYDAAISEYQLVYQKSEDSIRYSSLWNIVLIRCAQQNQIEFERSFAYLKRVINNLDSTRKNDLKVLIDSIAQLSHAVNDSQGNIPQNFKGTFWAPSQVWTKASEVRNL
jgi:hypothetical protein